MTQQDQPSRAITRHQSLIDAGSGPNHESVAESRHVNDDPDDDAGNNDPAATPAEPNGADDSLLSTAEGNDPVSALCSKIRERILFMSNKWYQLLNDNSTQQLSGNDAKKCQSLQKEIALLQQQLDFTSSLRVGTTSPPLHRSIGLPSAPEAAVIPTPAETQPPVLSTTTAAQSMVCSERPVPLPPQLPRFCRPTTPAAVSVREFITNLEDRLDANGFPRHRFVLALIACCARDEADWCRAELISLPWPEAREKFLQHYISDDMIEIYRCQLEAIKRRKDESVLTFADRYVQAMRLAETDPESDTRVIHFMHRLPDHVRKDLQLLKCSRPDTARSITALVQALVAIYPSERTPATTTTSNPAQWCPFHHTSSHSESSCRMEVANPAGSRATTLTRRKWCSFHNSSSHDATECRASGSSTSPPRTTRPASSNSTSSSNSSNSSSPTRCYKCQQPGHLAERCPQRHDMRPHATNHFRNVTADRSGASTVPSRCSRPPTPTNSADATVEDIFDIFDPPPSRSLHATSAETESGIDYATAFFVPIRIAAGPVETAYVDSGASCSGVPQDLFDSLPEILRASFRPAPQGSRVSLGASDSYVPRIGSVDLPFQWGGKQYQHRFEIISPPSGVRVMIGRDLFTTLGICITGLPQTLIAITKTTRAMANDELSVPSLTTLVKEQSVWVNRQDIPKSKEDDHCLKQQYDKMNVARPSPSSSPSSMKLVATNPALDADHYVVEAILDHKGTRSNRKYLVRWKGFPSSHDSWEPFHHFRDVDCINQYWRSRDGRHSKLSNEHPDPVSVSTGDDVTTVTGIPSSSGSVDSTGVSPPITRSRTRREST